MANLSAYAYDIGGGADHTYVKSSDGGVWACHGGSTGGDAIVNNIVSSSKRADAFSQSGSNAGIIYGYSGVCHQMANRILYGTNKTVSKARGYWASFATYGCYGVAGSGLVGLALSIEWENRKRRCKGITGDLNTVYVEEKSVSNVDFSNEFIDKIDLLHTSYHREPQGPGTTLKNIDILSKEVSFLIDYQLGPDKKDTDFRYMNKYHLQYIDNKNEAVTLWLSGKISGKEYADSVNNYFVEFQKGSIKYVGKEIYTRLSNSADYDFVQVIDPAIMDGIDPKDCSN